LAWFVERRKGGGNSKPSGWVCAVALSDRGEKEGRCRLNRLNGRDPSENVEGKRNSLWDKTLTLVLLECSNHIGKGGDGETKKFVVQAGGREQDPKKCPTKASSAKKQGKKDIGARRAARGKKLNRAQRKGVKIAQA